MKILIENAAILTMNSQKPFVHSGYLFIDKGILVTYGEGTPPVELEFADYVINESFAAILPGFVVGMSNIAYYLFQFNEESNNIGEMLSTLTRLEFETLLEASSNSWTRLRIVLPISLISTLNDYENIKKALLKGVRDQDAMTRKMISLGLLLENKDDLTRLSKEFIEVINKDRTYVYVENKVFEENLPTIKEITNLILLNPGSQVITPCNYTSINSWRIGCGVMSYDTGMLNPKKFLSALYTICKDAYTTVGLLSHENPLNNKIGASSISESELADIIVLSFREPPYGPLPISRNTIFNAISNAFYIVKTVIIGGEIVVDNGLHLFVGEEKVKRAIAIISELSRKEELPQ